MGRLDGKVALITGSGVGIGACTAKLFAKEGASVMLCARRENTLQQVKQEIEAAGGKAAYVVAHLLTLLFVSFLQQQDILATHMHVFIEIMCTIDTFLCC